MFWNQKQLPQPPNNTYKCSFQDIDLAKFRNALQNGVKHFREDDFLCTEAAILARALYRMKMKFRSSKEFKLMEKISRCLGIYFHSNIRRHLQNILDMTPQKYGKETYLPTKNMLAFILVKLQGIAKLVERIYDTCFIAATEIHCKFYRGHFWKQFLIMFALISRISILIKFNMKFLCELYGKLLPHFYKLKNTGNSWLPEGYVLPTDLRTWLSIEWVYEDEFVDLTFEPANEMVNFFNLADDDDDDVLFDDEYILLDDEDNEIKNQFKQLSPIKETLARNRMRGFSINEDDIGEEVTDIIELNDTVSNIEQAQASSEYPLTNKSDILNEDIGEEISLLLSSNCPDKTDLDGNAISAKGEKTVNNNEVTLINDLVTEDSSVISLRKEQQMDSDIIVLDDLIDNDNELSSIKKSARRSKRKRKSKRKSTAKANKSAEGAIKRKLEFSEIIPNKKVKMASDTVLDLSTKVACSEKTKSQKRLDKSTEPIFLNQNVSECKIKSKKSRRGKGKQKRQRSQLNEANSPNKDSNSESIICIDEDVILPPSKAKNKIVINLNKKSRKRIKARTRKQKQLDKKDDVPCS